MSRLSANHHPSIYFQVLVLGPFSPDQLTLELHCLHCTKSKYPLLTSIRQRIASQVLLIIIIKLLCSSFLITKNPFCPFHYRHHHTHHPSLFHRHAHTNFFCLRCTFVVVVAVVCLFFLHFFNLIQLCKLVTCYPLRSHLQPSFCFNLQSLLLTFDFCNLVLSLDV